MDRVVHPGLTFPVHVHPGVQVGAPENALPTPQRLLVQASYRKVHVAQIVAHVHLADEERESQARR